MIIPAEARKATRAYQATYWAGVGALLAMMLVGLASTLWSSHRLPSLKPLGEIMSNGQPQEVLRELSMSTHFTANEAMTAQLLQLANSAKDVEASILGTRHLIAIGGAWDAATFIRLAILLLQRGGALGNAVGEAPPTQDRGDIREALAWSKRAARLEPDNAEAQLYQGIAHASLDERDEAISHLRAALRLNPDLSRARRTLQALGVDAEGR